MTGPTLNPATPDPETPDPTTPGTGVAAPAPRIAPLVAPQIAPLVAALGERHPVIDPTAFLAATCCVLGDARIGADAGVWYGTLVRADTEQITVGEQTNLQDGVVLHADPGFPCQVGARVSVGHRAIVHGATVGDDVLVGMGATILNGARVGAWSLIAAGAVVLQGAEIPEGSLVAGVPGKVVRSLGEQERAAIRRNAEVYVALAEQHRALVPWPAASGSSSSAAQ